MRTIALIIIYITVAIYQKAFWINDWSNEAQLFVTLPTVVFFTHYIYSEIHNSDEQNPRTH